MYSTCTFCHAALGKNEALEHFPVGRRIAFDQARGRLWVVCPSCRQWNLSPLEARWEAIEEGEKLYRDTRLRVSTEQIGLARMRDGTELIRIGEPQRPEFAAWRYGDRFAARWRKQMLVGGLGFATYIGYHAVGPQIGVALGALWMLPWWAATWSLDTYRSRLVAARFTDEQGPLYVNAAFVDHAAIVKQPDAEGGWGIQVVARRGPHPVGRFAPGPPLFGDHRIVLRGANAEEAARRFLPRINKGGGRSKTVAEAVRVIEEVRNPDVLFRQVARPASGEGSWALKAASQLPAESRLALEMMVHEETERRALEGELAALEAQWKEAEEIAAIADELTLPARLGQRIESLRNR